MKKKTIVGLVLILKDVINTLSVEARCTALEAVHFIPFPEKKFGQVRAVLSCAAGY